MNVKKSIIVILIVILSLGVMVLLIFWVPSFFADEFNYINVTFSNNSLAVTSNPTDLFEKRISRWTDISATFKNNSQTECTVSARSKTLDKTFNLGQREEYGFILPKHEDVTIIFCGVNKTIRVN